MRRLSERPGRGLRSAGPMGMQDGPSTYCLVVTSVAPCRGLGPSPPIGVVSPPTGFASVGPGWVKVPSISSRFGAIRGQRQRVAGHGRDPETPVGVPLRHRSVWPVWDFWHLSRFS